MIIIVVFKLYDKIININIFSKDTIINHIKNLYLIIVEKNMRITLDIFSN